MPRRVEPPPKPPLSDRMRDPDELVRLGAVAELLKPDADPKPFQADVAARLTDDNVSVRRLAVLVLSTLGEPAVLDLVHALDEKQKPPIRVAAASALGQIGPPASRAVSRLCRCLEDPDDSFRFHASFALGKIGGAAVPTLRQVLRSTNPAAVCAAVDALGWVGPDAREAVPEIEALGSGCDPPLAFACPAALVKITGKPAAGVPKLAANLKSPDVTVRRRSAERLAELREAGREAESALLPATKDAAPEVRAKVAIALAVTGVDPGRSVPALAPLLGDPDPEVRAHAGMALAHLGPAARPALPGLQALAGENDKRLAAIGKAAIEKVEGKE